MSSPLQQLLALDAAPVAITFVAEAPTGVSRAAPGAPSSCTYWRRAAAGESFYTDASDHHGCAVGAFVHGVELSPAQQEELGALVSTMVALGYLGPDEASALPRRTSPFRFAVYAPLERAQGVPHVVLVRARAAQLMMLTEAVHAVGADGGAGGALLGRPTCAALPAAMMGQTGVASFGCIGNRVYTGLGDSEMYYAIPGQHLAAVVDRLAGIVRANHELEQFHRARLPSPTTFPDKKSGNSASPS